jgi:hypothetical protein
MYPSGYTQDTSRYIRIRILITNPPKLDNNPPLTRGSPVPYESSAAYSTASGRAAASAPPEAVIVGKAGMIPASCQA